MLAQQQITENSKQFFAAMNGGDVPGLLGTLAEDVRTYEPVGTPANEGHQGVLQWLQNMAAPFASMRIDVGDVYAVNNTAAISWNGHGQLKNGTAIHFSGIDVHEYNEQGKIQVVKGYFDPTPMMAAFGQ